MFARLTESDARPDGEKKFAPAPVARLLSKFFLLGETNILLTVQDPQMQQLACQTTSRLNESLSHASCPAQKRTCRSARAQSAHQQLTARP